LDKSHRPPVVTESVKALCEPARLRDGSEFWLLHDDRGAMKLEHRFADEVRSSLTFPARSAGLGGGRLVIAPSEKLIVVSIYSGQSEEGFEVVTCAPELELLRTGEYVFGEGASFAFSPSESRLAMAYPFACTEWWLGFDEGESEELPDGTMRFRFGELRLFDVTRASEARHVLHVLLPSKWQPPDTEWDSDLRLRFSGDQELTLEAPWGREALRLPAPLEVDFVWREDQ